MTADGEKMTADIVLINGKFYTSDSTAPWCEAVAIKGKKILFAGTQQACLDYKSNQTEVVDLGGKVVIPGIIDGHTHPISVAKTYWRVRMPFTHSKDELLSNIKEAASKFSKKERPYLFCENYFAETFGAKGPTKELLDEIEADRPVRIQDFTDHACWFNSAALELLKDENGKIKVESDAIEPKFVQDEDGEYTGWCLEPFDNIDKIICSKIGWQPPENLTDEMIDPLMDYFMAHGVTCLMDALTENEECAKYFFEKDKKGELGLFYDMTIIMNSTKDVDKAIATAFDWQEKYTTDHIHINTIKFFIDGTNELGDCCSLVPFANDPQGKNCGAAYTSEEDLVNAMIKINNAGLDLHIHCICDGAFRMCCDAYEKAKKTVGDKNWRMYLTLAHCELIDPQDMHRVAKLGIFIDWSTHWSGGYFGEIARDYLGDRWYTMYDFTTIIKEGGIVGYSSDVFTYQEAIRANPFIGMQTAMTRVDMFLPLDPEKYPGSVRPPQSAKLTLEQLLKGYTYNNAYRMRLLDKMGTIQTGKLANMVVLNRDIFQTPPEKIAEVDAEFVIYEGKKRIIKSNLSVNRDI